MKIPVLITGVSGGVIGRQCMKALKLKNDYRLITADMNIDGLGLYLADKSYLVPPVADKSYLKKVLEICKKEGIKVFIPGSEPELAAVCGQRELFKKEGILLLTNQPEVIEICQDKWLTNEFLKENGFKFPKSYIPKDESDTGKLKFPVVVKPSSGGSGSKGVNIAQDKEELGFYIRQLKKQGLTAIVQEYVGTPEEEYTVGVLHSLEGDHMGTFVLKRLVHLGLSTKLSVKSYKTKENFVISSGISQGIVGDYPDVAKFAEKVAEKIGSKGPLNIQCRKAGRDIYLFEINPRFSGTSSIRALCGYNEPDALIQKHLLGKRVKMSYKKGLVLRDLENYYVDFKKQEKLKKNRFLD